MKSLSLTFRRCGVLLEKIEERAICGLTYKPILFVNKRAATPSQTHLFRGSSNGILCKQQRERNVYFTSFINAAADYASGKIGYGKTELLKNHELSRVGLPSRVFALPIAALSEETKAFVFANFGPVDSVKSRDPINNEFIRDTYRAYKIDYRLMQQYKHLYGNRSIKHEYFPHPKQVLASMLYETIVPYEEVIKLLPFIASYRVVKEFKTTYWLQEEIPISII